jgi:hypothetical protein
MQTACTVDRQTAVAKRKNASVVTCLRGSLQAALRKFLGPVVSCLLGLLATPAHAIDGCKVMLCLAAPNWREVPLCVPTIHELMQHLARGRSFPMCKGAGPDNGADNLWATAPTNCPVHYVYEVDGPNGPRPRCRYTGAVTVKVGNAVWTRTWWTFDGDSVTEFSAAAKAQLGKWDTRFDDDYASWLASLPPPAPPCPTC